MGYIRKSSTLKKVNSIMKKGSITYYRTEEEMRDFSLQIWAQMFLKDPSGTERHLVSTGAKPWIQEWFQGVSDAKLASADLRDYVLQTWLSMLLKDRASASKLLTTTKPWIQKWFQKVLDEN